MHIPLDLEVQEVHMLGLVAVAYGHPSSEWH